MSLNALFAQQELSEMLNAAVSRASYARQQEEAITAATISRREMTDDDRLAERLEDQRQQQARISRGCAMMVDALPTQQEPVKDFFGDPEKVLDRFRQYQYRQ